MSVPVVVGTCAKCDAPVLYDRERREGACPCAATLIPAAFTESAVASCWAPLPRRRD